MGSGVRDPLAAVVGVGRRARAGGLRCGLRGARSADSAESGEELGRLECRSSSGPANVVGVVRVTAPRAGPVRLDHVRIDPRVVVRVGIGPENADPVRCREEAVLRARRVEVEELPRNAADDRVEDEALRALRRDVRLSVDEVTQRRGVGRRFLQWPRSPKAGRRMGASRRRAGSCSHCSPRSSPRSPDTLRFGPGRSST